MVPAQISINVEELLIALAVLVAAFLLFVGGIGWAFARFSRARFGRARFWAITAGGLAVAAVAGAGASVTGWMAAGIGSNWYDGELIAWLGLPVGIVAYVLAAGMLSRWPNVRSIAKARWCRWTLAGLLLITGALLIEVARPRTDGELLAAIADRSSYGKRQSALQILQDRGEDAAHLEPELRELIRANGSPSQTVWEMRTLATIAPTPQTVALLLEMAHRPHPAPAIDVIGTMGPAAGGAVPELLELVVLPPDGFAGQREVAAARAVSRIAPQQADDPRYQALIQEIRTRLAHTDPRFREGAANQLAQIGHGAAAARPDLKEMAAHDPDPRCRRTASWALAEIDRTNGQ